MSEPEQKTESSAIEDALDRATAAIGAGRTVDEGGDLLGFGNLIDVPIKVTVLVGRAEMTLGELVRLRPGSLVRLDREAHAPADILVNGKVVAQGEIVTIDDSYGVRITHVRDS